MLTVLAAQTRLERSPAWQRALANDTAFAALARLLRRARGRQIARFRSNPDNYR